VGDDAQLQTRRCFEEWLHLISARVESLHCGVNLQARQSEVGEPLELGDGVGAQRVDGSEADELVGKAAADGSDEVVGNRRAAPGPFGVPAQEEPHHAGGLVLRRHRLHRPDKDAPTKVLLHRGAVRTERALNPRLGGEVNVGIDDGFVGHGDRILSPPMVRSRAGLHPLRVA
jgi:hypothetical protein